MGENRPAFSEVVSLFLLAVFAWSALHGGITDHSWRIWAWWMFSTGVAMTALGILLLIARFILWIACKEADHEA